MTLDRLEESNYWRIGIIDPNNQKKIVLIINLRNQAISTSGNHEKIRNTSAGDLFVHHLIYTEIATSGRLKFHVLTVFGSNC